MFDPLIRYSAKRRKAAVLVAALATLLMMALVEIAYEVADDSLQGVRNRINARYDALLLRSLLTDAEAGQRGFLLTGHEDYLEPVAVARQATAEVIKRLDEQYRDSQWRELVEGLNQRVLEKLSELDATIRLYRANASPDATWIELVRTDIGKEKMDAVRDATARLESYESENIARERSNIYRALYVGRCAIHALTVLALLCFIYFLRKHDAFNRARAEYAENLRAERDQLDQQVQHRTEELTNLTRHLTTVREDERAHLARELHDELGALLTAAKLDIARARRLTTGLAEGIGERLVHLSKLIDDGITLKRRIIEDLRPSALSNLGLVQALEILAREFGERSELRIHTELLEVIANDAVHLAIYRLVQEALTNVLRHAKAKQVWIGMKADADTLVLTVRDDGQGFDPGTVSAGHHGLLGMRYRVEALGGMLRLLSAPSQGTKVEARLPFATRAV